ncbi:MAG TPA: fumarylacetoacetate hydrolase family protein [Tepidisphaeraceae bacterium]|jgi:2-dehydro-3-deoxy-D-arabinonate dehydratase|nr:fumarylacetoacetate hydrolase family protein [Tepidisphaeraceae bacterium]
MRLYLSSAGPVVERDNQFFPIAKSWDEVLNADDLPGVLASAWMDGKPISAGRWLAPISSQEVWAAGVTYFRSRTARMEESKSAGGGDFYDRVYAAARPELFFKGMGHRAIGNNGIVRIRRDSKWNVPEPELTLVINRRGRIVGYTIGNDMSSRDIEGENPLYLPQAKVYDGSLALGPAVLVAEGPLSKSTEIRIEIHRGGACVFEGSTTLAQMKREPEELMEYLYREMTFSQGCYLLTGTGVVPPDAFTLQTGDEIRITIEGIGTLGNAVG